jgi:hypothetical protein
MKSIALSLAICLGALAIAGVASAQSWNDPGRFSVGLGVGTNGGVVEGAYEIDRHFVVRAQGAFLDFSHTISSDDTVYGGAVHFNTGGLSLDWHPFANTFLFTVGAISGAREVNVSARPVGGSITIDGVPFTAAQIGSVNGHINFGSTVPVAGIGFDNTYVGEHHWGIRALVGVAFGPDPPTATLQASGPFASNPTVGAELREEQQSLGRHGGDFSNYPIAQIGLTHRF